MSPPSTPHPTVLITGASSGIGKACTLELDHRGFRVFAGVRSEADAENLRSHASPRLTTLLLDVTDSAAIARAATWISESVGNLGLSGLVNNAGIANPGPLELVPLDVWRKQLEVNILGQVGVTQAFLPLLRKGQGRIVNISSVSGGLALPFMSPYSASKHAIEAITDALRLELHPWNIHVAAIEPGPIQSSIWAKSTAAAATLTQQASPEIIPLYQHQFELIRKGIENKSGAAQPVETVVKAVIHALTAKKPKTRYLLNWNGWIFFQGLRMLPDRLRDWLLRKAIGLS